MAEMQRYTVRIPEDLATELEGLPYFQNHSERIREAVRRYVHQYNAEPDALKPGSLGYCPNCGTVDWSRTKDIAGTPAWNCDGCDIIILGADERKYPDPMETWGEIDV